jgi:nitroimidazol reductase NimA-like FMN-containing flavoprotein (pyridoxamine 5'-phosphate oxidase superfamily)
LRRDDFLRDSRIIRLATAEDGGPHVTPLWYLYDAGKFYIGTSAKSRKVRNIQRDDRVGFCVDVGINAPNIYGVAGQGRARLILDSSVKGIATRILMRYFESMTGAAQDLLDDTDCIVEITPDRTWGWQY